MIDATMTMLTCSGRRGQRRKASFCGDIWMTESFAYLQLRRDDIASFSFNIRRRGRQNTQSRKHVAAFLRVLYHSTAFNYGT